MDNDENIKYIAPITPIHSGVIKDKSIKTLVREINAINCEEEYAKRKHKETWY